MHAQWDSENKRQRRCNSRTCNYDSYENGLAQRRKIPSAKAQQHVILIVFTLIFHCYIIFQGIFQIAYEFFGLCIVYDYVFGEIGETEFLWNQMRQQVLFRRQNQYVFSESTTLCYKCGLKLNEKYLFGNSFIQCPQKRLKGVVFLYQFPRPFEVLFFKYYSQSNCIGFL